MACAALELLRALLLQKCAQLLFKLKLGGVGWELATVLVRVRAVLS